MSEVENIKLTDRQMQCLKFLAKYNSAIGLNNVRDHLSPLAGKGLSATAAKSGASKILRKLIAFGLVCEPSVHFRAYQITQKGLDFLNRK
ncbi:MAG TPA: hypothetical protein VF648_00455 [Pyrinomonadaceae bacterium]|jgi:hypothetical protein